MYYAHANQELNTYFTDFRREGVERRGDRVNGQRDAEGVADIASRSAVEAA